MKCKIMKLMLLIALLSGVTLSAQNLSGNNKILHENTKESPFKIKMNLTGTTIAADGTVTIPSLKNTTYKIKTSSIETELISERINYMAETESVIVLKLTSQKPKVYELLYVYNLLSVADYKKATEKAKPSKKESVQTNSLEQAQQLCFEGKYIHALSMFYDIAYDFNNKNAADALFNWNHILFTTSQGWTLDSFDNDYDTYAYWYNLLNEFEDFWFEECPVILTVTDFDKGEIDLDTSTITYEFKLESRWTKKYSAILDSLKSGIQNARKDSWNKIPVDWPKYSCRSEKGLPDSSHYFAAGNYNSDAGRYVSYATFNKDEIGIIYSLYTLDGTAICKNQMAFPNERLIQIKDVSRKLSNFIDKKQVKFVVEKIITRRKPRNYEYYAREKKWDTSSSIPSSETKIKDIFNYSNFIVNTPFETPKIDYDRNELDQYLKMSLLEEKTLEILTTEVTQGLYTLVTGTNPSNTPSQYNNEDRPVVNVTIYDAMCFCNRLSEIYQFTPVYSVNGETDITKWPVKPFTGWPEEGKVIVKQNPDADGYRLPTIEEWKYAANRNKNQIAPNVAEIKKIGVFAPSVTPEYASTCKTKKPNEFGLYDMFGNVYEIAVNSLKEEFDLCVYPIENKWTGETKTYFTNYLGGDFNTSIYADTTVKDLAFKDMFDCLYNYVGFRIIRNAVYPEYDEEMYGIQ